ncbi:transcription factor E2F7 [Pholidichthys leucotaenia]
MEVDCLALKDLCSPKKRLKLECVEDEGRSDQKENMFSERRRSTPDSLIPTRLTNRNCTDPDPDHITPVKGTTLLEPWTPTANLKMLISAASPDIRDREMKKVLFRPRENDKEQPESPDADTEVEDSCQFEVANDEDDEEKKPSRKQKSLGLLCLKFLALYPDYPPVSCPIQISLDEVATSLGVERRRIYDIINVLESLMMVGRIAKNRYSWYGRHHLEQTLEELQMWGRLQGYHLHREEVPEGREAQPGQEEDDHGGDGDAGNGKRKTSCNNRKDKSLRIMSQKFVMLFLVSQSQTVTLDSAAKILIDSSQEASSHSKYKTKVRRLYDIANVLTSLGLIKKVHVREERGRKPAFIWLGPLHFTGNSGNLLNAAASNTTESVLGRSKMTRHSSFNITPTSTTAAAVVHREVSSAPSTPRREQTGLLIRPVDYSRKTRSDRTACQLEFGNVADSHPLPPLQTHASSFPPSSTHSNHLFTAYPPPHCLAYLPSLSQPSLVMLYRTPDKPRDQRSPTPASVEGRKTRRSEDKEEEAEKKRRACEVDKVEAEPQKETIALASPALDQLFTTSLHNSEEAPPSHYLYVPNSAGLNSLNLLLPAGLTGPPTVTTVALPYVLLPSSTLPHYPLVDAQARLSFGLMSPVPFVVGRGPYSLAPALEASRSPNSPPSMPDQSVAGRHGSSTGTPRSPSASQQTVSVNTPEPQTPHTPKESSGSSSETFFQTPGTLGNVVSAAAANRKRGSAQRRLDIGHPPRT